MKRRAYRIEKIKSLLFARTVACYKELISEGADVNAVDLDGRTPLHHAILHGKGLDVVRELLKHGACVNSCDKYDCTPLIAAVKLFNRSELDVVKVLLEYGANPNVWDNQGCSLLTRAIHKNDWFLLKELLEWGADINIANRGTGGNVTFVSPMVEAVTCYHVFATLFIKMTLLKQFDNNYNRIINLNIFRSFRNFNELSVFKEDCVREILRMKSYIIGKKYSLFELVVNYRICQAVYFNDYAMKDISNNFPIYEFIIALNMSPHFIRGELFSKIRDAQLQISVMKNVDDGYCKISLNTDCSILIAEYLNNNDLSALIDAYAV